jgi:hypothetical protein
MLSINAIYPNVNLFTPFNQGFPKVDVLMIHPSCSFPEQEERLKKQGFCERSSQNPCFFTFFPPREWDGVGGEVEDLNF